MLSRVIYLNKMRAFLFVFMLAACLWGQAPAEVPPNYTFTPAAVLNEPRLGACLVGLGDGRALAIGGELAGEAVATVELYSPDAGWTRVASMAVARVEHTCTLLLDGKVMVAGGRNANGSTGAVEFYSVDSDSWQRLSSSGLSRWRHSSTLLTDGRVLLAGGQNEARIFNSLEVVDPWFGMITVLTTTLRTARTAHAAGPLAGGGAFIAGGFNSTGYLRSIEVFNLSGRVDEGPALVESAANLSATPLLEGGFLIAGGIGSLGEVAAAQVYNPASNSLRQVDSMPAARSGHVAIPLEGNGRVLIAGGVAAEQPVISSYLFDSTAGSWTQTGDASGSLAVLAGAQTAPGKVMVLGEWPQAMAVPSMRFDQKFYTQDQVVRIGFENFGSPEALVRAASSSTQPAETERTLPTGEGLVDLLQVARLTAGRRWQITAAGASDGNLLRASFQQKSKVFFTMAPAPASPLAFENTVFKYDLTRESDPPGLTWPPNITLRVTGTTEGATASSFAVEFPGDVQAPSRDMMAGGTYSVAARLTSLTDLYDLQGVVFRTDLVVRRRTPAGLEGNLPSGTTALGERRTVTAGVRSGLSSATPRPSGSIAVSRGGYKRGEVLLPPGTGSGSAAMALGQAGALPVEFAYSGDHNYEPISMVSPPFSIQKGNVGLTVEPLKKVFAVGENALLDAVITHPKVLGAVPTGRVVQQVRSGRDSH